MRVIAAGIFAGLFWSTVGAAAPPVAWVLGDRCVLTLVYADGRNLASDPLEPGCDLEVIAFGDGEAALLFRTASGGPKTLWRVTARSTRKLAPPASAIEDAGYDGKTLIAIGLDSEEAYSKARAAIATIVPNDPGCRPAVRKSLALQGSAWVTRLREEGPCSASPMPLRIESDFDDEAEAAAEGTETYVIFPEPQATIATLAIRERFLGDWLVQGDPPRVASQTQGDGSETLVVILDARDGGLVLRVAGRDPIVYERAGVRIISTDPAGLLVVRDGKPLFNGRAVSHSGYWGVRQEFPVEEW